MRLTYLLIGGFRPLFRQLSEFILSKDILSERVIFEPVGPLVRLGRGHLHVPIFLTRGPSWTSKAWHSIGQLQPQHWQTYVWRFIAFLQFAV